jgi:hypothetical protein
MIKIREQDGVIRELGDIRLNLGIKITPVLLQRCGIQIKMQKDSV